MHRLLKPGGYLVILAYPLAPEPYEVGPPHYTKPKHYVEALGEGWEKVLDKVPVHSLDTHVGLERIIVYKKL